MKPNQGEADGMMEIHTITLRGGPYHGQTRPVPEPPAFKASIAGINAHPPAYYYVFHHRPTGEWEPTAIYIQDPITPALFHFHAYAKDTHS